ATREPDLPRACLRVVLRRLRLPRGTMAFPAGERGYSPTGRPIAAGATRPQRDLRPLLVRQLHRAGQARGCLPRLLAQAASTPVVQWPTPDRLRGAGGRVCATA